jgi:hypothetical protein
MGHIITLWEKLIFLQKKNYSMVVADQKWWKCYVFMYVTIKMRSVETMPGMRDIIIEENDELG